MVDKLYFSSPKYKKLALNSANSYSTSISIQDAFFLLINGVDFKDLDLFCTSIKEETKSPLSLEEIYQTIQNPKLLTDEEKMIYYEIALSTLSFGSHNIKIREDFIINTSSWINHSINVSIAARNLASAVPEADPNIAQVLGLLHDVGRKFKTDMQHTISGYEYLVDNGLDSLARVCLTHSHINAERCANNEPAVNGWSCQDGISIWDPNVDTDDLTKFLQSANYNIYDSIINIADLMATSDSILPVYDRILDIATRRKIDATNRNFFFSELINLLNGFMTSAKYIKSYSPILATSDISNEVMEEKLRKTSSEFSMFYNSITNSSSFNKVFEKVK